MEGAMENSETLAVILQVQQQDLPAEITILKKAVRGMPYGPRKKHLNKARSDYRIMNNLS